MKRARADIYYTSCAGALLGQVVLFARLHGARVVFRIASTSDCDPAAALIRYWRDKRLYRYGLRRADLVLAQTPGQQQALLFFFCCVCCVVVLLFVFFGWWLGFVVCVFCVLWVG